MRKVTYKWTDEQLITAVKENISLRQVMIKLGLKGAGQNYRAIPRRIKELNLDTSHFLGQAHLRNKTHEWAPKQPLENILIENSTYLITNSLKRRLLKENLLKPTCSGCERIVWRSNLVRGEVAIPLELDHKNGTSNDNRIENLRLLCPNCHALTNTYRGKNIKKYKEKQ